MLLLEKWARVYRVWGKDCWFSCTLHFSVHIGTPIEHIGNGFLAYYLFCPLNYINTEGETEGISGLILDTEMPPFYMNLPTFKRNSADLESMVEVEWGWSSE